MFSKTDLEELCGRINTIISEIETFFISAVIGIRPGKGYFLNVVSKQYPNSKTLERNYYGNNIPEIIELREDIISEEMRLMRSRDTSENIMLVSKYLSDVELMAFGIHPDTTKIRENAINKIPHDLRLFLRSIL